MVRESLFLAVAYAQVMKVYRSSTTAPASLVECIFRYKTVGTNESDLVTVVRVDSTEVHNYYHYTGLWIKGSAAEKS